MSEEVAVSQDERVLAGLAHSSILVGFFTNGVGGIAAALVIWLTQKEKSDYAAFQALQALVYQVVTLFLVGLMWCCWGVLWAAMILGPLFSDPRVYNHEPPAGLWIGLALMIVPLGIWGLTFIYGLWGGVRCFGGHDFKYAIIGNWLARQTLPSQE
jgi:uncharacterized Tic20 family protein